MRALAIMAPAVAVAALLVSMPAVVVALGVVALTMALAILGHGARTAEGPLRLSRVGPFMSAMGASVMALWATLGLLS